MVAHMREEKIIKKNLDLKNTYISVKISSWRNEFSWKFPLGCRKYAESV